MKVEVDKGLCIGCGSCISTCPECFEFDEHGKSQVKADCDQGSPNLKTAADDCPVAAITISE